MYVSWCSLTNTSRPHIAAISWILGLIQYGSSDLTLPQNSLKLTIISNRNSQSYEWNENSAKNAILDPDVLLFHNQNIALSESNRFWEQKHRNICCLLHISLALFLKILMMFAQSTKTCSWMSYWTVSIEYVHFWSFVWYTSQRCMCITF